MKHARLIRARRGARGGYWLAKPAADITIADVIRAVEGPLANIHESAPEDLHYEGAAERLRDVWVAVRAQPARGAGERHPGRVGEREPALADRRDAERPADLAQALSAPSRYHLRRFRVTRSTRTGIQPPLHGSRDRRLRLRHRPARRHDRHGRRLADDPLLILVFGISPVTAIGTDIFYAAITKTVGGFRHLKLRTVHRGHRLLAGGGQRALRDRRRVGDRAPPAQLRRGPRQARARDARRRAAGRRHRDPAALALLHAT